MKLLRPVLLGILVLVAVVPSAQTAPAPGKPYTAAVTPASAPAGSRTTFTATLSNPADAQQQLGAAQLTAPAGLTLVAGSVAYSGPGTVTQSGNLIQFNNVAVQPGNQLTFTVDADIACSASGVLTWNVRAKQANEFNGSGNLLDLVGGQPTTTVAGACRLAFETQPADARTGESITGTAYTPAAQPPVRVEVVDGSGARVTSSTASITLAMNTGPAALSGTKTAGATAGLASFANVNFGTPGTYTLIATSSGLTSATSDTFRVVTAAEVCLEDVTCTTSVATTKTRVGISALPSGSAFDNGFLTASMNSGPMIDCAGYQEVSPDVALVDMTSLARTKTATLTIDKKQMTVVPNNGASFLQFCFGSPVPFITSAGVYSVAQGTPFDWDSDGDSEPVYVGLLPNCSGATPAPCVTSRSKTGAGDGVIKANLPAGDPAMRG